jgi:peroxiredoxin
MKMTRKSALTVLFAASAMAIFATPATAKITVGDMAPDVQVLDSNGNQRALSEFKGKDVVLEWTNHQCPYVKKHYSSNNMQKLQKRAAGQGVVWLTVISSAPGKQGHVSAEKANELSAKRGATPTAVLLDESGDAGRAYDAKATPHMYVVDKEGVLKYQGAIDSIPNSRVASIEDATNYVSVALDALANGTEIEVTDSQAYGCTIKY